MARRNFWTCLGLAALLGLWMLPAATTACGNPDERGRLAADDGEEVEDLDQEGELLLADDDHDVEDLDQEGEFLADDDHDDEHDGEGHVA